MEILKFDSAPQKRTGQKKSSTRGLLAVAGFAAIAVLGSTLAANISLNSGTLEFGQGVVTTAACDTSITILPTTAYTSDTFTLSTIVVSDLNTTACNGKSLKIKVLSGSTAKVISTGANTTQCSVSITTGSPYAATTDSCGTISINSATGFTLTPSATLGAVFVDRITVESS